MLKKRAVYVFKNILWACFYFILSYYIIFIDIANRDLLTGTILNIIFIFILLFMEKLENYVFYKIVDKLKSREKPTIVLKIISYISNDVPFKPALYFFYIVVLICSAILSAEPEFRYLSYMSDYFKTVDYGILVLLACDQFLSQVFKHVSES